MYSIYGIEKIDLELMEKEEFLVHLIIKYLLDQTERSMIKENL
jgi:hypothetical protein